MLVSTPLDAREIAHPGCLGQGQSANYTAISPL